MNQRNTLNLNVLIVAVAVGMLAMSHSAFAADDEPENPWRISVGCGVLDFEGDEPVSDGFVMAVHLGYAYSEWITVEGVLTHAPELDGNFRDNETINILEELTGAKSTSATGIAVDGLFHFPRAEMLGQPYLAVGVGFLFYEDAFNDSGTDFVMRGGGGVTVHLGDQWALRFDAKAMVAGGDDPEANSTFTGSFWWSW